MSLWKEFLRALTEPLGDHRPPLATARRPWLRRAPYVLVLLVAGSLLPTGVVTLVRFHGVDPALATALAAVQAGALPLALTRPLPAWRLVVPSVLVGAVATHGATAERSWPWPVTTLLGYLLLMVLLAVRERGRTLLAVWVVTFLGCGLGRTVSGAHSDGSSVVVTALSGVVLLLGWSLRGRGEAKRLLAAQERVSETERARRALLEERARIARELHDVVAHHMSVITVQADSAPYRIEGLPPAAVEEFGQIAAAARGSLGEMRRLLGVLRTADSAADRAPQPGLADLPKLLATVGRAGVRAELAVGDGVSALGPVPEAVGLSAYRIVQEALANVVRHAPGAAAEVAVTAADGALALAVRNGPPPGRARAAVEVSGGTGQGLVGMRERVRLLAGTLDTGPTAGGGYRVTAVLPLDGTGPGEITA
ncbi:signal transduction histidine kinase [Kitasatospora sp. SolWspMP-SS2h]|uniref:sensor histidine kinase n=1 Tax=Kitasatospora sp. SolWspMP-SS2h TaxID=1305729 RepID=UPI000DBFCC8D|nr:histidine kinase [Kitasatospora sp. SolWspMP-SS2h]RAJ42685.1 signal transduction histidine kinase [Kitasatospora sp. SolWspMP-SS2h]